MPSMIFFTLVSLVAAAWGASEGIAKRALPIYHHYDDHHYQGHNAIDDYGYYPHFAHSLPAYSTVSYVMSSGHYKPVSYSGFTNHGRGHHDPGYAIQYRSDGFLPVPKHAYYHHHYY